MAIRMMVHCRKCNREFDWNNDEGYAKMPDGSYLCSISCDLKETLDKLALALAAIEAAKEYNAALRLLIESHGKIGDAGAKVFVGHCDSCRDKYFDAIEKLEAAKC